MLFVLQISDISFEQLLLTSALFTLLEEKQSRKKTAASTYTPLCVVVILQHEGERRVAQKTLLHGLPLPFQEISSCCSGDVQVQLNSHPQ